MTLDWPFRRTFKRKRDAGNTDVPDNRNRIGVSFAVRIRLLSAGRYDDLSAEAGSRIDTWKAVYFQVMPSVDSIAGWVRSARLRPFLKALDEAEQPTFPGRYL